MFLQNEKNYNPKVSIVIPAYNASNYLAEAIDSALAQTYKNIEIIVVNDGSKDDGATAEVVRKYGDKIRYFEKENGGSSSALNVGIDNMTGEWFSWLSHDDLYYPAKVEKQIAYLNELDLSECIKYKHIFFSASDLIDGNGKIIRKSSKEKAVKKSIDIDNLSGNEYLIAEPTKYNFHGCSCLIHKDAFKDVGKFDENLRLLNDIDMWVRLYFNNYIVHYVPEVLVMGRVHGKQISHSIGYSHHNSEMDWFWNRRLEWLLENHPNNYELYELFGRNAYLKTRNKEGDKAFAVAKKLKPNKGVCLSIKKYLYILYAKIRSFAKKVYILLRM